MYKPEIINELNEDKENKNKCILLGYEKIKEEKENELENEDEDEDKSFDGDKKNKEILKREKVKEYKNKINKKIKKINENQINKISEKVIYDRDKNSIFGRTPITTPISNYNNNMNKTNYIQNFSNYNFSTKNNNILTETNNNNSFKKNKIKFPQNKLIDNSSNFDNTIPNKKNINFETNLNNYGNNNSFSSNTFLGIVLHFVRCVIVTLQCQQNTARVAKIVENNHRQQSRGKLNLLE